MTVRKLNLTEERYQWTDNLIIKFKAYCVHVNRSALDMILSQNPKHLTPSQLMVFTDAS